MNADVLGSTIFDNPLSGKDILCPQTSANVRLWTHGVQGVASSNPAVPTREIDGLAVRAANPFAFAGPVGPLAMLEDPRAAG